MRPYLLSFVFVFAGLASVAADDLPKAQPFARYQEMMNRSPFAVATAAVVAAPTPNFAKDLYIANAARTTGGDLITLASTVDKNFKKYLTTKEPVEGYNVVSVEWSDRVGETKVTIGKDGQTATLTFNQALLSQTVANSQPPPFQPPPQPQGQPANIAPVSASAQFNPNAIKPQPIPSLPTPPPPPPRVRGVIQRNPNGAVPQAEPAQKLQDD